MPGAKKAARTSERVNGRGRTQTDRHENLGCTILPTRTMYSPRRRMFDSQELTGFSRYIYGRLGGLAHHAARHGGVFAFLNPESDR